MLSEAADGQLIVALDRHAAAAILPELIRLRARHRSIGVVVSVALGSLITDCDQCVLLADLANPGKKVSNLANIGASFMTVKGVSEATGHPSRTIRYWAKAGRVPGAKVSDSGAWLIPLAEVTKLKGAPHG